MTRISPRFVFPLAFLAGALVTHCSSSSTTTFDGDDGGSMKGSSRGSASATLATTSATATLATSGGITTATTGAASSGSVATTASATTGASGSAGTACPGGPSNGFPCTPGVVTCNNAACGVPANECCNTDSNKDETCLAASATCTGNPQACDEKTDCSNGQICCLAVTGATTFTISCQNGPTCPKPPGFISAAAQLCTTDAECSTGKCQVYNCQNNLTEACQPPSPDGIDCKVVN